VHDLVFFLIRLEVGHVESHDTPERARDRILSRGIGPPAAQICSHLPQRAEYPRTIESLPLTMLTEVRH